jgi:hypothetical protein
MIRQTLALLLCVTVAVSGCASVRYSRTSRLPAQIASSSDPSTIAEFAEKLPAGSRIRVDTASGRTLHGTLIKVSADELVIQRNTRVPVSPEAIATSEIARVMLEPATSSNGKLIAVGAAIGAGAAIAVVWTIAFFVLAND